MATKPRALLVDDEAHVRTLMKTVAVSLNFNVICEASTGQQAVSLYKTTQPDITFLDINMPRTTGETALREIMAHNPDACVIMLTSVVDAQSVERCLNLGAAGYIRKDTPLSEMKTLIRDTWNTHAPCGSRAAGNEAHHEPAL